MNEKAENTLRIDPETGAVIISETMIIEPEWTMKELEESEAFKKYAYIQIIDELKELLVKNVEGKDTNISVSYDNENIKRIKIKIAHASQGETASMQEDDYIVLREILYKSFVGFSSEDDSDGYIRYRFPWGSVVITYDNRGTATHMNISFKRQ